MEIRSVVAVPQPSAAAGSGALSPEQHFAAVMESVETNLLGPHLQRWRELDRSAARVSKRLGVEGRSLIEMQLLMQRLSTETQVAAAVGEAIGGLFKKLQQLAGGG